MRRGPLVANAFIDSADMHPGDQPSMPRSRLILLADPIAVAILVAAVAVTVGVVAVVVIAIAVVVVAVSGGTDCRGTQCGGTDRRSAIRIIPATIGGTAIGYATARNANSRTAIGHATAGNANSATSDTCRANPAASAGTATAVSECVIRNEGHPHKEAGRETYDSFTQHWCSPSLTITRWRIRAPNG